MSETRRQILFLAALGICMLGSTSVGAQEIKPGEKQSQSETRSEALSRFYENIQSMVSDALSETKSTSDVDGASRLTYLRAPDVDCASLETEALRAVCVDAVLSYYVTYVKGLEHRTAVFQWQYFSAIVIFVVVLLVVSIGLYFAYIQFRTDVNQAGMTKKPASGQSSEVEISTSGIKVSSPVLGVIILAISVAFLYLYLVHVYPISEIK